MSYEKILELVEQIVNEKIEIEIEKKEFHDFEGALAMRTMFHTLKFLYEKKDIENEIAENYIRDMLRVQKGGQ